MDLVAPCVGAWIETPKLFDVVFAFASLPAWERGLKRAYTELLGRIRESLPAWERGLKLGNSIRNAVEKRSLPAWERGLKQLIQSNTDGLIGRSLRGSVD